MVGGKMCVVLTHMVRAIEAHFKKKNTHKKPQHMKPWENPVLFQFVCLFLTRPSVDVAEEV